MTDQEKRERLHNRPTRYELIAERGDQKMLIAYTMRQGRHVLLTAVRQYGPKLVKFMGLTDEDVMVFRKPANLGAHIGPAANPWRVYYTGRTQRECIGSELPFIGDWKELA